MTLAAFRQLAVRLLAAGAASCLGREEPPRLQCRMWASLFLIAMTSSPAAMYPHDMGAVLEGLQHSRL